MKQAAKDIAAKMLQADPGASFAVQFWDGDGFQVGDGTDFVVSFRTRAALGRTFGDGFLGFGESYMAGEIEVGGDLLELLRLGHLAGFGDQKLSVKEAVRFLGLYLLHQNTKRQSKLNISHHYDVGNDFYALCLDESMTYTCAYYRTPDDDLATAQRNKHELVCRKLLLEKGMRVADLGCGWGGFLIHAARTYGVTGVGVTRSQEQCDFANRRIAEYGLQDRIEVRYQDYRDLDGEFDRVATLGMLEHVGKRFIPTCAGKIEELLAPQGLALLHFIGNDRPWPDDPWSMKYMFPGSHIPVLSSVIQALSMRDLEIRDIENLRQHYILTTRAWRDNYERNVDQIREMFDEVFVRQWRLYWNLAISSFEWGGNRLFQILVSKGANGTNNNTLPLTRAHLYRE